MSVSQVTEIRAVDLFCGVGGLTHGLVQGGIKVNAGIDLDSNCTYPYEANNSASFINMDVADLDAEYLGGLFGKAKYSLLAGCAPCQPFSTYSRTSRKKDVRADWSLIASFGRLIKEVKPDFVTMENVPSVVQHSVFDDFLNCLKGYHFEWSIVECINLGVPQTRKRLVLLASKLGPQGLNLNISHNSKITVQDAIGHLPKLRAGSSDPSDPLHVACRLSALNLKRIRASKAGGTWRDWPEKLRADCHRKSTGSTFPSVYGRMSWDEPAPTMTTQCFGYGNGRFGHPCQDRAISLREAAILQTFPQDYIFLKKGEKPKFSLLGRLIGNAVPVQLGKVIGETLQNHVQIYQT